jgi:signal transduction histidine kinase
MPPAERGVADQGAPRGVVLVCGRDGVVQQVLRDDLGVLGDAVGQRLTGIVDRSSLEKTKRFLTEVATTGAAFDWELGVPGDRSVRLLHFAGSMGERDTMVVVGAQTRSAVVRFYHELVPFSSAEAAARRPPVDLHATDALHDRDADIYEKMMRLNSELATVQRELTKKNLELERANQLKNQFLGMAAHDLRNPIGAIRSFSMLLLDAEFPVPIERRRNILERIKASSDFMLGLIDDLLDLSAIESGQLRMDARDVDIAMLVRENVELNRALAKEKQIDVTLDVASDVPHVLADARKVEQILNNLLSNAVKFSSPGTVVRVSVRAAEEGVWLVVADQGPGIPAAELATLFRPFHRGTPRGTAGERSTGLGLAIVKRLVDGHGGRLSCDSIVGRGTTFSVWLPESGPTV